MKCIVLAGGGGLRLWPLSRRQCPKQFLKIGSSFTMLEETIFRNQKYVDDFTLVTNEEYCLTIEKILDKHSDISFNMLLETIGRNTAPAIALAALTSKPDDILFVVPADAKIEAGDKYSSAVAEAKKLAEDNSIVTFGVKPTSANVGYGYIKYQNNNVIEFKEKPRAEIAEQYFKSGEYLWNCGMFMFKSKVFLDELKKFRNDIYSGCMDLAEKLDEKRFKLLPKDDLLKIPAESVDYAVMEKSDKVKVVPCDFAWNDIGGLESLCETVATADSDGNRTLGSSVILNNCNNVNVINEQKDKIIVVNGLEDIIITNTNDAIYITKQGHSQDIKSIIEKNKDYNNFY